MALEEPKDRISVIRHRTIGHHDQQEAIPKMHTGTWRAVAGLFALLICTVLFIPGNAFAQEFRGTISGSVLDQSGAVVPGASVEVRETHTGTLNKTVSDKAGQYVVPFLPPGDYSITVSKAEFQTLTRSGITLQAQEHPIINLTLTVGSTSQTVTVTAEEPLVDQANSSVGQVISTQSVEDLPLNGRTPVVLATLSVGVVTTSAPGITHPFDNNAANSWSVGGTPKQVSEVLLDGSPNLTLLGAQAYSPTQDSVREVSVRPFDTDASFGHTIGGVINQITKGGTNSFHGTMYEFNQISNLDANLYFNSAIRNSGTEKPTPTFHYNQYGFTFGGPVIIPKVVNGKDKLFFFFAWEGLRDKTPQSTVLTVPTEDEKDGDFHALLDNASGNQLYLPGSGTAGSSFARTAIPHNCLTKTTDYCKANGGTTGLTESAIGKKFLDLYPKSNASGSTTGMSNYNSNAPSQDNYTNEFGRLDYNLRSSNHLFFDFRHNHQSQIKNNYFANNSTGSNMMRENFGATLDDVITITPTTIFDARLSWTYFDEIHGANSSVYSPTDFGLPSSLESNSTQVQLPYISLSSYQSLGDYGSSKQPTTHYQVFADLMKLMNKHTLKIGFDGRRYLLRVHADQYASGKFAFGSSWVNSGTGGTGASVGGDLADLFLGLPTSGEYDVDANSDYRSYYIGTFVQDDWRISNRLTVNLGLRFDIDTPYGEKFGRTVSGFDPTATNTASTAAAVAFSAGTSTATKNGTTVSVSSINTLGGLTFPSSDHGAPYQIQGSGFWSPRVGFSYNPAIFNSKMVIRGGFGLFVQPETMSTLSATGSYSSSAIDNQEGFNAVTSYVASSDGTYYNQTGANTWDNPFPTYATATGSTLGASTFLGSPSSITFLAPVQHDPYSERWNLGVQHSITNNMLLEVIYVGNHSVHLPVASQNINATKRQYLTTNPYADFDLNTAMSTTVPNPFYNLLTGTSYNAKKQALGVLTVPYPQFGSASVTEQNQTIGQSFFHSGMIHIQQRAKHGLTLTANYSFSKLIEQDSFLNDVDTSLTRRISPFDHSHHFTVGGTYKLPFGRGKMFSFGNSKLMDELLGNFVVNGIYQFQTGAPLYFSNDLALLPGKTLKDIKSAPRSTGITGSGNSALVNASSIFVEGANKCTTGYTCDGSVYNSAIPNANFYYHYRTFPQTMGWVRTDGFNNMDLSILKDFKFTESARLQLRFETFNTLNHAVFAAPDVTKATSGPSGVFGYITGVPTTSQPRQIQLGGRIVF
jgi:hypothetical protein